MISTGIQLAIKIPGFDKIKRLERNMKALDRNVIKSTGNLKKFTTSTTKATKSVGSLASNVGKLAAGFAAFQSVKAIGQIGIDSIEADRRLKALAGTFGEVQAAEQAAERAAEKFGLTQREAAKSFSQIYARLRPIGIEIDQIETAFNGFNTAARLSGTSAQEASAAWLQLSQALGSGVLRGEELNSIFEQTPTVVQAIAKEINAPIGQIRKLASEGKITSDIVLRALKRLERDGVDQLAEAMKGPRQQFKNFSNSVEELSNALATTVLPDLAAAISDIGDVILALEGPIRFITGLLKNAIGEVKSLILQLTQPAAIAAKVDIEAGRSPSSLITTFTKLDPNFGVKQLFGEKEYDALLKKAREYAELRGQPVKDVFIQFAQDRLKALEGDGFIKSGDLSAFDPKKLLGGNSAGSGISGSAAEAKRLADQAERLRKEEQEAIKNQDQILERLKLQVAIAESKSELKKLEKGYLLDILELEQEIKNRSEGASATRLQQLNEEYRLRRKIIDTQFDDNFYNAGFAMGEALAADIGKVNTELTDTEQLLNNSFNIVTDGLTNGIKGLIEGTSEWNDVLSDVLGNLGNMLLQFGFNSLGSALKIPGFADGGLLPANGPAIVGERGPELVMSQGGQSRVFSNQETTAALQRYSPSNARSIEELAMSGGGRMKSEWGFTGSSAPMTVQMDYSGPTMVFDDERYLPVAAVPSLIRQAAKQGEAQALRRLQRSPGSRRKLGL